MNDGGLVLLIVLAAAVSSTAVIGAVVFCRSYRESKRDGHPQKFMLVSALMMVGAAIAFLLLTTLIATTSP